MHCLCERDGQYSHCEGGKCTCAAVQPRADNTGIMHALSGLEGQALHHPSPQDICNDGPYLLRQRIVRLPQQLRHGGRAALRQRCRQAAAASATAHGSSRAHSSSCGGWRATRRGLGVSACMHAHRQHCRARAGA
jgi:hypothetical protein